MPDEASCTPMSGIEGAQPTLRRLDRSKGAEVFGADAAGYHAGRIGYPAELYDALVRRNGAVESLVEIGPGTGLATQVLIDRFGPSRYIAIEADAGMSAHLRSSIAASSLEVVTSDFLSANVEGPFDLAGCAAAFHWMPPEPALAKLRRILRPGGTLALWWNSYRQAGIGDPFADAVTPLLADLELPPSEGPDGHYSLDVDLHRKAISGAGFVDFEPHLFRRGRFMTTASVVKLYASYSYVRVLPEAQRTALLDAIARLADREFGGTVPNVILSALYLAANPA
jgi:SAM-dependent methyltransferase